MRYDVVVIGGGSAGAVVAARLSEDPARRVLVLDAGAPFTGIEAADQLSNVTFALTHRDWGFRALAGADRTIDYPQGRAFGGGSSVNGALALRGEADDYDAWTGADGPWCWEQMLPRFRRLEADENVADEWHGTDGPIPVVRWHPDELVPMQVAFRDGCVESGLDWVDDLNRPGATGVGAFPMNRRDGVRMSTAICYLGPAMARPNLHVLADARAHRLRVADGNVVGVEVRVGGDMQAIDAGEVVVAAGAINTPALLLRSGIGDAADVAALGVPVVADLPGVGAGLVDHPGVFLLLHPRAGVVDMEAAQFQLGVRCTTSAAAPANDLMIGLMNFWDLRASPDYRQAIGADMVSALTCGLQAPRSRGSVTLTSADPDVPPRVDLGLLSDGDDLELMVAGLRRCWHIVGTTAMSEVVTGPAVLQPESFDDDDALRRYVESMVAPWYHPCGTARMGPDSDPAAVVGTDLRVHGLDGLRIVDASVLPTIPRAPTNLTVIAVAERAADLMTA